MSLETTIDGQSEVIVRAQLAQGNMRSPEELVELALQAYSDNTSKPFSLGASRKSSAEAVAHIQELRNTVSPRSRKFKDLTREGHKYRWQSSIPMAVFIPDASVKLPWCVSLQTRCLVPAFRG
jgi:hypothetical protein